MNCETIDDTRRCPRCGWPDSDLTHTVSHHPTQDGATRYTRCVCGALQVRVFRPGAADPWPVVLRG